MKLYYRTKFLHSLKLWFEQGEINKQDIVAIMKQNNLYNVESESTYIRRTSTIRGWLKWINCKDMKITVEGEKLPTTKFEGLGNDSIGRGNGWEWTER